MKSIIVSFVLIGALVFSVSCKKDDDDKGTITPSTSQTELSEDEEDGLIFMREEEKLARDVYLKLNETYSLQIFTNIAASEQVHMDSILSLLVKYNVQDPASPHEGIFNNAELQKLYDDLVSLGEQSLLDALTVGAAIEELDIRDLQNQSSLTNKEDILLAYEFLSCGSRNHLRSFNKQIENNGGSYTAAYLTQAEYDAIAGGVHEQCGKK